ncbi:hypothetical protein VTI28DRAFT_3729 [Corynascus sepedonium]
MGSELKSFAARNRPFHFVRVDVVTHKTPGHLDYKYSLHIIGVWSNYHWVNYGRTKSEMFDRLKDWIVQIHNQTGNYIQMLGLDGGTELGQSGRDFRDSKLAAFADANGITVLKTTPSSPWQNGKVERVAADIIQKARTTIFVHRIPEVLWPFVVDTTVTISNLLPTRANSGNKSPHELFATAMNMPEEACKPLIRHLRTYFCHAYYYIKPDKRDRADKFGLRAEKGRLISAVKFNEGDDYRKDEDIKLPEHETVFTDTTAEEDEESLEFYRALIPGSQQQKKVQFDQSHTSSTATDPTPTSPASATSEPIEDMIIVNTGPRMETPLPVRTREDAASQKPLSPAPAAEWPEMPTPESLHEPRDSAERDSTTQELVSLIDGDDAREIQQEPNFEDWWLPAMIEQDQSL